MAARKTYGYPPFLMGAAEAAAYINVSPRVLSEMQARGEITPLDGKGKRSFRRDDLEEWAERRKEWHDRKTA